MGRGPLKLCEQDDDTVSAHLCFVKVTLAVQGERVEIGAEWRLQDMAALAQSMSRAESWDHLGRFCSGGCNPSES